MKTNRLLLFSLVVTFGILLSSRPTLQEAHALNSCAPSPVASIIAFSQGLSSDGTAIEPSLSDPNTLLGADSSGGSLALGIGGSLTVSFAVPLANYPAAGTPEILRPADTSPCSTHPVQATIFGSPDGIVFTELGITCEGGGFSLQEFPWISYLRIVDTTDRLNPAFSKTKTPGFTVQSIAGPGCLKFAHCGEASSVDPTLAKSTTKKTLSLGSLGSDFILSEGARFEEYGNGTARFIGSLSRLSNPDEAYDAVFSFTGRVDKPPTNSPVLLLQPSAYFENGGPVDPSLWHYYKTVRGTLLKVAPSQDQYYSSTGTIHALQIGVGADGRSGASGASSTFTLQVAGSETLAELAFTLTACPTATPTPNPSPSPTPPVVPTDAIDDSSQSCSLLDLTASLAFLDQELLKRSELVFKASRATVKAGPSRSNLIFQTQRRSRARTLSAVAWAAIWQHPWSVLLCPNTIGCSSTSLSPLQENIRNSVKELDLYVAATISAAMRRVHSRSRRSFFRKLRSDHARMVREFNSSLERLPTENFTCPSAP